MLAIGNFDGVHRGHRTLVAELIRLSREHGSPAMVFTFDPPPARLLRPGPWPQPLTWMERRAELLENLGIDHVLAYPTTSSLLELSAESFFRKVVIEELGARGLVEGPNFRFGKDRGGDVALLSRMCREHHLLLSIIEPERIGENWVSSSSIREAIDAGDIERANAALGEPYRIRGKVHGGAGRGRTLGFPTANLGEVPVLIPGHGVYAGRIARASWDDGRTVPERLTHAHAAIHIGPNPTFGEEASKVEIHVLDFAGDLYGATLEVEMVRRIRGIRKFSGLNELIEQIQADLRSVSLALSE